MLVARRLLIYQHTHTEKSELGVSSKPPFFQTSVTFCVSQSSLFCLFLFVCLFPFLLTTLCYFSTKSQKKVREKILCAHLFPLI